MLLGRHTSFFPEHQQNSPTFPHQINSVNFHFSGNCDYVENVPSQNVWQLLTSAMVSSRQNSNWSSAWNVMPSSDRRHTQDKTVLSCLVLVGNVNWIGDKTRQFCSISKCGVNWVLSCLGLISNLQLFSLKYIEDYWKLSWLVANSVHTTSTDKTRQCVLSVTAVWTRL